MSVKLSPAMEDYLKVIYLIEKESKVARVSEISRRLSVRKASVVAAVRLLQRNSLLTHEKYGYISLTEAGKEEAGRIIKKGDIMLSFLIDVLKIPREKAVKEACDAEHSFSEETAAKIAELVRQASKPLKPVKPTRTAKKSKKSRK